MSVWNGVGKKVPQHTHRERIGVHDTCLVGPFPFLCPYRVSHPLTLESCHISLQQRPNQRLSSTSEIR